MNGGRIEAGRQLERVFRVGTVGGLSDAELLERFAAVDDDSAGAAFEAIVERHGPMVLRVCRMVLRDAHAAEDAFQATFLVLARRARTLGERERLGNWLYGVATRTARKARIAASRRIARDRVVAGRRPEAVVAPAPDACGDELGRVLHEEIDRLPGAYRAAVVACYLEGLTQAQAARELRTTETTVRGRLARARKLLENRLTRRGLAPAAGLLALENLAEACAGPGWPIAACLDRRAAARCARPVRRPRRPPVRPIRRPGDARSRPVDGARPRRRSALHHVAPIAQDPRTRGVIGRRRDRAHRRRGRRAEPARGRSRTRSGAGAGSRSEAGGGSRGPPAPGVRRRRQKSSGKTTKAGASVAVDKDLAKRAPGRSSGRCRCPRTP